MKFDYPSTTADKPVNLTIDSTTADIARLLRSGRSENEIENIVLQINHQGRGLFGNSFRLRLDPTSLTKDIVARAFIITPGR